MVDLHKLSKEAQLFEEFEKKLNFYKSIFALKESSEKAALDKFDELKILVSKNLGILKTLNKIPIYEQPEFKCLFRPSIWDDPKVRRATLFDVIMITISNKIFVSYWVKDNKYIGFVSYQDMGEIADGVTIYRFDKKRFPSVVKGNTLKFMDDIINSHKITKWEALIENERAIKSYDVFLIKKEKIGFPVSRIEGKNGDSGVIFYSVENLNI
jgi:hypothetical protein